MKGRSVLGFFLVLLIIAAGISMMLGRYPVGWRDAAALAGRILSGGGIGETGAPENVFLYVRLPRVAAAVLVGAALSVSGAAFQSMFMNPLVSPGLLGVLAGASFGAALGMVISGAWIVVQVCAFSFGCAAVLLAMTLARFQSGDRLLLLILGGIVSASLFTALLSVVKYLADPYRQLPAIVYWLMGGLSAVDISTVRIVWLPMGIGVIVLIAMSPYMNVLSMGDEEARALGVNVTLVRVVMIFFATMISALTVVVGGIIGWVGLVIPHLARMIFGPDNRILVPASAVTGALYLLVVDDLSRLVFSVEIPIGILTALCGIPFFAVVLRHARKGWG